MFAKSQCRGSGARSQIFAKASLIAKGNATAHPLGLLALGLANARRRSHNLPELALGQKYHAVGVADREVAHGEHPRIDASAFQAIRSTRVKAQRPGWDGPETEKRQADLQ